MSELFEHRPYGLRISNTLIEKPRCLILAGMGSGKTAETLTAWEHLSDFEDIFPALIVAPLRVCTSVWPDEIRKWEHLQHRTLALCIGSEAQRSRALRGPQADYYAINYESLDWLVRKIGLGKWPFKSLIIDEITKIKGFRGHYRRDGALVCTSGKAGSALARITHAQPRVAALTGGFIPHSVPDIWAQTWMIDKGVACGRSYAEFQRNYLEPTAYAYDAQGKRHPTGFQAIEGAFDEILSRIAGFSLVIDPADYFDLEAPIIRDISVKLPEKALRQYRQMEKHFFAELASGGTVAATHAGAKSLKLLQMASGFLYAENSKNYTEIHSEKIQALHECVEEASGMPILCAYHWNPASVERLARAFPKGKFLDKNPDTVRKWNAGEIPILFAHPASAGHGLNLGEGGNILVHFDLSWNAGNYEQMNARVGPMRQLGRGRPAYRYHIIARDTLDTQVLDVLEKRLDFQQAFSARLKLIQASA